MKKLPSDNDNNPSTEMVDERLAIIYQYVIGLKNITNFNDLNDVRYPILKPSLEKIYPIFLLQYGLLATFGIALNIFIIYYVVRYRLYCDVTQAFLVNLAFCHFIQCTFVMPITLFVILIQNWIFGQFMCFFLPLLQDIPLHVCMMSHLLIACDRMRWLSDPLKIRLPSFVCSCATWLAGMVIALPYPIYITYLDLGLYVPKFDGVGVCIVNLVDDMQEYMRGLFIIMYCGPTTILAYLYIRTSRELRPPEEPIGVMMFEQRADARNRQRSTTSHSSQPTHNLNSTRSTPCSRSYDLYDAEVDVTREKRTQRHLGTMATTQVICTLPLMILRVAKLLLSETYENTTHFDLTYLMFIWIAFLPTVIIPCIYGSWMLSRSAKERLRGYFRLSSSRRCEKKFNQQRSTENSITQETTETYDDPSISQPPLPLPSQSEQHQLPPKKPSVQQRAVAHQPDSDKKTIKKQSKTSTTINQIDEKQSRIQLPTASNNNNNKNNRKKYKNSRPMFKPPKQLCSSKTNLKSTTSANVKKSNLRCIALNDLMLRKHPSYDEIINNSCSNITTSTYCNCNDDSDLTNNYYYDTNISTNLGDDDNDNDNDADVDDLNDDIDDDDDDAVDDINSCTYEIDAIETPTIPDPENDIHDGDDEIFSDDIVPNRRTIVNPSLRRDSSSIERDMEIIDLLQRERSMDILDVIERERIIDNGGSGISSVHGKYSHNKRPKQNVSLAVERHQHHRKLPDITRINGGSTNSLMINKKDKHFPNLVFTHNSDNIQNSKEYINQQSSPNNSDGYYSSLRPQQTTQKQKHKEYSPNISRTNLLNSSEHRLATSVRSLNDPPNYPIDRRYSRVICSNNGVIIVDGDDDNDDDHRSTIGMVPILIDDHQMCRTKSINLLKNSTIKSSQQQSRRNNTGEYPEDL